MKYLVRTFATLLAFAATSSAEWKTMNAVQPSGPTLYAYVESGDDRMTLQCRPPGQRITSLQLSVRVGDTGEYLDRMDPRATIEFWFGEEKPKTPPTLPGIHRDYGEIKYGIAFGPGVGDYIRLLQSVPDDVHVALSVVLRDGPTLRTVSFPLEGVREAVSFLDPCLQMSLEAVE